MPLDQLSQDVLPCMSRPGISAAQTTKKANLTTGTSFSHPPGWICHHYFNGAPLLPPQTNLLLLMAKITLTTNGQSVTIDGEATFIHNLLLGLNFTAPDTIPAPIVDSVEQKALKYIDFFGVELNKYVPGGKFFVSELNRLRIHKQNDYSMLRLAYAQTLDKKHSDYNKHFRLLEMASAIWRYTFAPTADRSRLKNQIMRNSGCSDCGKFASAMVDRMIVEKLWV